MKVSNHPTPRYLFRRFEILKHIRSGKKFMEIGAGNLLLSQELLSYFEQGVALDFYPELQNKAKTLPLEIKQRLQIKQGNFLDIHLNQDYECIVACEVMEHVEQDEEFMSKIYNLLIDGGQVIISVPARNKYWSIDDELVGHIKRYEKNDLLNLFESIGFKNINIISYGYPFVNWLRFMRIALAKTEYKHRHHISQIQLTQESNQNKVPSFLRIFANKYLFLPFNILARRFNRFDLSEAYLVIAYKIISLDHI